MQTRKKIQIISFILCIGLLFSCENQEEELNEPDISNEYLQSKSASVYGEFRSGTIENPTLRKPNSDWYYAIRYKYDRTNGEFIQPDAILYLKGATVGAVEVITKGQGIPSGWVVIDEFNEYDEFGNPEERLQYQYIVIQYQG